MNAAEHSWVSPGWVPVRKPLHKAREHIQLEKKTLIGSMQGFLPSSCCDLRRNAGHHPGFLSTAISFTHLPARNHSKPHGQCHSQVSSSILILSLLASKDEFPIYVSLVFYFKDPFRFHSLAFVICLPLTSLSSTHQLYLIS